MNNIDLLKIQLGDFIYDPKTHLLTLEGKVVTPGLTPTEARVLEYLYANNDRSLSRDELLKIAAEERVVEPEIITQYIRTIRKALGDSASQSKYIRTYQKAGYQFIGTVEIVPKSKRLSMHYLIYPAVIICVFILFFIQQNILNKDKSQLPIPITSLKGQELFGDPSPDGKYFVFSHKDLDGQHWNLVLKKRTDENFSPLTEDNTHANANSMHAKFSPSGNQLMYHHFGENINQIRIAEINWNTKKLENIKVQIELPLNLFSIYLDWKNEETIIYSSQKSTTLPSQIFTHNIESKTTNSMIEPTNDGAGDLAIAYSAKTQQVAYLRNIGYTKTEVWLYNFATTKSIMLKSIPVELWSIDWSTDDNHLVIKTNNKEISLLSIKDGTLKSIYKGTSTVYAPFVLDSENIAYSSGDFVLSDIQQISLNDDIKPITFISSSYNDNMPTYVPDTGNIVFISNRSGLKQIWLKNKDGRLSQLSHFQEPKEIHNLSVNSQKQLIAFTTNAKIHLLEMKTGKILYSLDDDNISYNNPTFSSDGHNLIYSLKGDDKWLLEKRNVTNLKIRTILTEGYIVKPCKEGDCFYYLKSEDPTLYKYTSTGSVVNTSILLEDIVFPEQFEVVGNNIYSTQRINNQPRLITQNLITKSKKIITSLPALRFTFNSQENIIYATHRRINDTHLESISIK